MTSSNLKPTEVWHRRGRVPHFEAGQTPQFITFRLADSLPRGVLASRAGEQSDGRRRRVEAALDAGHGESFLADPLIGRIVEDAILHFDGERCRLHAWCVMPTHVHVLTTPLAGQSLSALAHAWKSFTAHAINKARGTSGRVWAEEYFDRVIRDEAHFEACKNYIENNPVKAGLCAEPLAWPFSSAAPR